MISKLTAKTLFGWGWTNDYTLPKVPENVATGKKLRREAPWDCPCFRSSNYYGTTSSYSVKINKNWYPITENLFDEIVSHGVAKCYVDIENGEIIDWGDYLERETWLTQIDAYTT